MTDDSCAWRRRWPEPRKAYAAAVFANEAGGWVRPVVARSCANCDGWHLYIARPRDAHIVAAMRELGIPRGEVITSWTTVDDYGWEVHVTAYQAQCLHCGKPLSGIAARRAAPAEAPLYCSRSHSQKARDARNVARDKAGTSRILKA